MNPENKDNEKRNLRKEKRKARKGKRNIKKKMQHFWLWSKHFSMKWRFRLDQSRAIFGLITFAVLLADKYVSVIPWFKDQGFWSGDMLLSVVILILFLIVGYLYDRLFKLWTETQTVNVERNPYTYVPNPKEYINNLAIFSFLFDSLNQIAEKLDVELRGEELIRLHLKTYYDLSTKTTNFETKALKLQLLSKELQKIFLESGEIQDYDEFFEMMLIEAKKAKEQSKSIDNAKENKAKED
ncbi:MAG: hypothetical protein ACTSPM_06275 [Candidatus Heimdallarchaeota archaeon]